MIGHYLMAAPGLIVAGACVVGVVREIRRWPRITAEPSLYDQHRENYVQTGDPAELELALRHVEG